MDENVIAERDGYRVRLALQDDAEQPYNDGGTPIWRIEYGRDGMSVYGAVQETGITSYVTPGRLDEAIGRLWRDGDLERYLRIFWGVTASERWHSGNYWYFTCDPAEWREALGITDEATAREGYGDNLMAEWQAWCNGDVYGWIVERSARKTTKVETHDGEELSLDVDDDYWVEEDAVWGHYGYEYATEAALDALAEQVPELLATCPECEWAEVIVEDQARWDAQFKHMVDVHKWRTHKWTYGDRNQFHTAVCYRSGCNVMGTGDWYNDGECEGTD